MYTEDVERLFQQDIREKKRAASGAFHMRGKGVRNGFSGAIRTPYHFMSNKERKKLNGEVVTTNMYETIIPKAEFDLKDKEMQRTLMMRWREIYPNTKIMKEWGMSGNASFAKIVNDLDIPKKQRINGPRGPRKPKTEQQELSLQPIQEPIKEAAAPVKLIINGLAMDFHGTYDAETINKKLTKIQLLLEEESNNFEIHLSVLERN